MNGMIDFVANFNLFMSSDEPEKPEDSVESGDNQDHNLHDKEKPKYRKKTLNKIFRMNENEKKRYSKKNKNIK